MEFKDMKDKFEIIINKTEINLPKDFNWKITNADCKYASAKQIRIEAEKNLLAKESIIQKETIQTLDNIYKAINEKKLKGQNYLSFTTSLRLNQLISIYHFLRFDRKFDVELKIEGVEIQVMSELEKYISSSNHDSRFDYNTAVFNISWFKEIK